MFGHQPLIWIRTRTRIHLKCWIRIQLIMIHKKHCVYNLSPTLQDMDEKELNKAMEMPAGLQNLGTNTHTSYYY
jgi:hypothetical protein